MQCRIRAPTPWLDLRWLRAGVDLIVLSRDLGRNDCICFVLASFLAVADYRLQDADAIADNFPQRAATYDFASTTLTST